MIKIEKGVPIPEPRTKPRNGFKEAFEQMEVGDSFCVPNSKRSSLLVAVVNANKSGKRFSTRRIDGEQTRVWRIK